MLTQWFAKHPAAFTEKYAVKIMHKKLECAEKKLKDDPKDVSHMADLAKVYEMLCDYFAEKQIDPRNLI